VPPAAGAAPEENVLVGVTRIGVERHRRSVSAVSDAEVYGKCAEELIRFAKVLVGPDAAADVLSAAVITAFGAPAWLKVRNPRAYL
jgi:hypothetical protein